QSSRLENGAGFRGIHHDVGGVQLLGAAAPRRAANSRRNRLCLLRFGCGLKGDKGGDKGLGCLPARSLERPGCTFSRGASRGILCPTYRQRQSMGASSICFECPAGVLARPVLRTISAVSGVNGR
ncbi:unnamed protein product, partial [Ascophyllum nodosum]